MAVADTEASTKKPYEPIENGYGYFIGLDGRTYHGEDKYDKESKETKYYRVLISEGYAYISKIIEPIGEDSAIFVIPTKSINGRKTEIRIKATDASEGRKLNAALVNKFGIDDVGKLTLPVIKALSGKNPEYIQLFKKPQWFDGKIVVPGLGIENAQFQFLPKVVINFDTKGDASEGVKALDNIVKAFDPLKSLIGIVTFLGAPIIAYLWKGDRYVLVITGVTGSMKTAIIMLLSSIYGVGYSQEANIVRWGEGTTTNAASHLAAFTGPFPFVLDNFKLYTTYDASNIQKMIHGILEGTEKARMQQNSNDLRESEEYQCIPVITVENYPGEDAASRARGIFLNWSGPRNLEELTIAQGHIADLNALGRDWCLWLSSDEGKTAMKVIDGKFTETRSKYIRQIGDAINAGRIATNAAIIELIWELMGVCPVTEGFVKRHDISLKDAIDEHILHAVQDVNSSTEADKFISWLRAEIEIGKYYITSSTKSIINNMATVKTSTTIAHYRTNEEGMKVELLMLPDILDNILLPEWQKSTNGVRSDKKSLKRQLHKRGYLQYDEKNQSYTLTRKINSENRRVLVFDAEKVLQGQVEEVTSKDDEVVAQKQQQLA